MTESKRPSKKAGLDSTTGWNHSQKLELIIWLLTARCNLSCLHCYSARFSDKKEIEPGEAANIIKSAAEAGVKHIGFTGGEVLLRPDIMDLISLASRLGISTNIVTNGFLINDYVAEKLAEYNVFTVLSVDGATKEVHEKIRGKGTWNSLLPAIERLRHFGVSFATVMAINSLNYDQIPEYIQLARKWQAAAACIIPVMPAGKANKDLVLAPDQVLWALQVADKAAESLEFPVSLWCMPFAPLVTRSKYVVSDHCRTELSEMDIAPGGEVLLCDVLDITVSNVREKGILGAWQEQRGHPVTKAIFNPELPPPCSECPQKAQCKGGCFARAALISGNLCAPDPLCPRVAKIL